MAKKFELKERGTGEVVYPVTSSNCVVHDGQKLDEVIDNKAEVADLSNVIYERVVDEDNFGNVDQITREQLKKDLFIDMWDKACDIWGKYNKTTGYFELNGLTDITYEDAVKIYNAGCYSNDVNSSYYSKQIRTHLPPSEYMSVYGKSYGFAFSDIEVINMSLYIIQGNTFCNCTKLHTLTAWGVHYTLSDSSSQTVFSGCKSLKNISFLNPINVNVYFNDSPLITLKSFNSIVNKSNGSITITVHPDIYNAILGESTEYPFNGGSKEEWSQLLEDATSKNITFTTI